MYGIVLLRASHCATILERSTAYSSGTTQAAGITMKLHVLEFVRRYNRFASESISLPCGGMQFLNADNKCTRFHPMPSRNTS
jgi:hypothetical protein